MVSGLVAYGEGAQEMGEKRRREALTSIRRKPKLRRKSVKVERTANTRRTHNNPQDNAQKRTRAIAEERKRECGSGALGYCGGIH